MTSKKQVSKNSAETKSTEHRKMHKKKWLIPSILITVGIVIFLISTWLLLLNTRSNPAYQAAKPIEAALLKQGAVKKCETGDPGLGPDNDEPWYEAYYTAVDTKEDTEALLRSLAEDKGKPLLEDAEYKKSKGESTFKGVSLDATVTVITNKTLELHPYTCTNESILTATAAHPIVHLNLRLPRR